MRLTVGWGAPNSFRVGGVQFASQNFHKIFTINELYDVPWVVVTRIVGLLKTKELREMFKYLEILQEMCQFRLDKFNLNPLII